MGCGGCGYGIASGQANWLNRDPIGEAGGINLYRFNRNNPVSFIDPWGLTTYVWPPEYTPAGSYGPSTTTVNDGSDAVYPAVPYLTDSQGLGSTDLDFLPFFLPEIPAVSKAMDALGDALGNLGKDALDKMGLGKPRTPPVKCPTTGSPKWPGTDPAKAPPGTQWRGRPGTNPGDPQGAYYNPNTGESYHPDLNHPAPVGPHWDYVAPDGTQYRIMPDGSAVPKK
jgi:uncharacterized protein RhaS with RHS repeats